MQPKIRSLELLAPAADKEVAREAILHGADAVYMGGPSHGARRKASNSIEDIRATVEYAHQFRARVYVTVNTLVYEKEIPAVEKLVWDLYRAGVDALIVQDMALLRMKLPPIALHASTQCDTRTPQKARFLEDVGFSQIVLARELSLDEIREVCGAVTVPVECFVHGALCVSYSGRCGASQMALGRSANRGECAQMCRLPYTLVNGEGKVIERDKYLLSLRDFKASAFLEEMIEAGVSSFKIEGRLKDAAYVKNVTAAYRRRIDEVIAANPGKYRRSSFGESEISFTPCLSKSFNRGFTDYFLHGRRPVSMASLLTPKSMGEEIENVGELNNGDGISFFNDRGEYEGVGVNRVSNGRIISSRRFTLPKGATIHRTFDRRWQTLMAGDTAARTIAVDIEIDETGVTAHDERDVEVRLPLDVEKMEAKKRLNPEPIFAKLGNTVYRLRSFENNLNVDTFIPASQLTALRRRLIEALDEANEATYPFDRRRSEQLDAKYPQSRLDQRDNVANSLAESFYRDHGVTSIPKALEVDPSGKSLRETDKTVSGVKKEGTREEVVEGKCIDEEEIRRDGAGRVGDKRAVNKRDSEFVEVMTTRYCMRRELGVCLRDPKVSQERRKRYSQPLTITTGPHRFQLDFDCARCEMRVLKPTK